MRKREIEKEDRYHFRIDDIVIEKLYWELGIYNYSNSEKEKKVTKKDIIEVIKNFYNNILISVFKKNLVNLLESIRRYCDEKKMGKINIKNKDILLLVIAKAEGHPLSPVQIQKSLFLIGEKFKNRIGRNYYKFIPHYFGPFCKDIYTDAQELAEMRLITIEQPVGLSYETYMPTRNGTTRSKEIEKYLPEEIIRYIKNLVQKILSLSFEQLISAIYEKFPKYSENSVFRR